MIVFTILLAGCARPNHTDDPSERNYLVFADSVLESQADPMKERIEQRCKEITTMYYNLYIRVNRAELQNRWDDPVLPQSSIDAIEGL